METFKELKKRGFTKWKISKVLNVAWHTVHMWDKGTFKPTKEHKEALEAMLKNEGVS